TWSPDGTRIAFSAAPTTMIRDDRSDVYIATVASKAIDKITANLGPDTGPAWSPDGKTIAYLSSPNSGKPLGDGIPLQRVGNEHLMLYDVATRTAKDASSRDFDLSPGALHWLPDSRTILFSTGVKTYRELFTFDVASGRYTQHSHGRIVSVGSAGKHGIALVAETSSAPAEIYFADSVEAAPRKLTDT